jgi:hypothetical protein
MRCSHWSNATWRPSSAERGSVTIGRRLRLHCRRRGHRSYFASQTQPPRAAALEAATIRRRVGGGRCGRVSGASMVAKRARPGASAMVRNCRPGVQEGARLRPPRAGSSGARTAPAPGRHHLPRRGRARGHPACWPVRLARRTFLFLSGHSTAVRNWLTMDIAQPAGPRHG